LPNQKHFFNRNVLSVLHFLSDVPHAYLKNEIKKYQLNFKRIQNLPISSNVALLQQKMLINAGKTQI